MSIANLVRVGLSLAVVGTVGAVAYRTIQGMRTEIAAGKKAVANAKQCTANAQAVSDVAIRAGEERIAQLEQEAVLQQQAHELRMKALEEERIKNDAEHEQRMTELEEQIESSGRSNRFPKTLSRSKQREHKRKGPGSADHFGDRD